VYLRATEINKVKRGLGILLLSTSKGILSDQDALHLRVGGEALCYIV
jgi:small subunit ribosomal protein S8